MNDLEVTVRSHVLDQLRWIFFNSGDMMHYRVRVRTGAVIRNGLGLPHEHDNFRLGTYP